MGTIKINGYTLTAEDGSGNVNVTVPASAVGATYAEPSNPSTDTIGSVGDTWVNTTTGELFTCILGGVNNNVWVGQEGTFVSLTPIGVFGGGDTSGSSSSNVMEYINIDTPGNATDFGDLTAAKKRLAGVNSATRGVFGGGGNPSALNTMDYITIATPGNATDFGDLTVARNGLAGVNSHTRGVFGGGVTNDVTNVLDYITIATPGNATDFGILTVSRWYLSAVNSSTRGVFGGGVPPANTGNATNVLDYITIATPGNATDFGDLTVATAALAGVNSSTRGVFAGAGTNYVNIIDYITIATPGNATDFGALTVTRTILAGVNSTTRGVFAGGIYASQSLINTIDYITITTLGNATDFGDLTAAKRDHAGVNAGL